MMIMMINLRCNGNGMDQSWGRSRLYTTVCTYLLALIHHSSSSNVFSLSLSLNRRGTYYLLTVFDLFLFHFITVFRVYLIKIPLTTGHYVREILNLERVSQAKRSRIAITRRGYALCTDSCRPAMSLGGNRGEGIESNLSDRAAARKGQEREFKSYHFQAADRSLNH